MPNFSNFNLSRFFKRGSPVGGATIVAGARPSLSVNSLSKISNNLTALGHGETIRTVSFWLCLILCANFTADLFALLFEKFLPSTPASVLANRVRGAPSATLESFEVINSRNLFSSRTPKSKKSGEIDFDSEPILTSLPYQLTGTVIFHNPAHSLAAIQDKTENKLYPVRIGDQIGENVQILSIEARKVIFINSSARRKEFIEIPEDPSIKISAGSMKTSGPPQGIAMVEENKFVLSRNEIDSQMANFNALITQARAVPEMRGGQMIGFKLTQIVPGSFYQKAGFKENDIITSVNGEKITDAAKALGLLQEIKTMSAIDIGIEQNGKAINRNYDIR